MLKLSVTFNPINPLLPWILQGFCDRQDSSSRSIFSPESQLWPSVGAMFSPGWPYQCPQFQLSLMWCKCLYNWFVLSLMALPFTLPPKPFKRNFTFIPSHQVLLSPPLKNLFHLSLHCCPVLSVGHYYFLPARISFPHAPVKNNTSFPLIPYYYIVVIPWENLLRPLGLHAFHMLPTCVLQPQHVAFSLGFSSVKLGPASRAEVRLCTCPYWRTPSWTVVISGLCYSSLSCSSLA